MLSRILALTPKEIAYLGEAVFLGLAIKVALSISPFKWVYSVVRKTSIDGSFSLGDGLVLEGIAICIGRLARFKPLKTSCLELALVARFMLYFRGLPSLFTIGVKIPNFEAHAWLTSCGIPIVGVEESGKFKVLERIR